jgi:hypothetical protein
MPEEEQPNKLGEQLAKEVAALRDLAIKSTDPLIVAKAVAVSDEGVQHAIRTRLQAAEQLVEVFAFQGSSPHELQVFFRFVPVQGAVNLMDTGLLAFVDAHKGAVIGTLDPFVLQPERRVGRPFVTVAALDTARYAASTEAMKPLVQREQAFFANLGLGGLFGGQFGLTTDTVCDTGVTSTTYSGQPYRPDDTGAETTGDYCDSRGSFLA